MHHQVDTYNLVVVYNISKVREIYLEVCKDYYSFNYRNQNISVYKDSLVSRQQIEYLMETIESKLVYLGLKQVGLSEARKPRYKRGLIDGLGSVVKAITGNLDQEDARRFENQIREIRNYAVASERKNNQVVGLMRDFMNQYNDKLDKIRKNQEKLVEAISEINRIQSSTQAITIYSQIGTCLQQLYDRLLTLENAITFSNLGQLHPSVVDPNYLIAELINVQNEIEWQLAYSPSLRQIHQITKSITVKAYSTNETLNFILEVPLVTNHPYSLLHLYSIPNENNTVLIPKNPYLILGSYEFAYPRERCLHITESDAICRHVEWQPLKRSEDCIAQLIQHEKPHNCSYAKVNYDNNIIQQIKENSWIIILKREEIIKSTCGNDVQYQRTTGVALVSVDNKCVVKIGDRTLRTHRRFINIQESIPLPKSYKIPNNFTINIKLEDVQLDSLKDILQKAKEIKEPIYVPALSTRPSWSSVVLYIIIISIGVGTAARWYWIYRTSGAARSAASPADEQQQQQPLSSARFSLKGGGVTLA